MPDIHHRVGIHGSPDKIYQALTTDAGLAKWWTKDTSGAGEVGSTIAFRFLSPDGTGGGPDFSVAELVPNKMVRWTHSGSVPEAWMGTGIVFQLRAEDDQTFVRFTHSDWSNATDFMAHCSTKWAVFLLSLKDYIEKGEGRAFPNDIQIDHS